MGVSITGVLSFLRNLRFRRVILPDPAILNYIGGWEASLLLVQLCPIDGYLGFEWRLCHPYEAGMRHVQYDCTF